MIESGKGRRKRCLTERAVAAGSFFVVFAVFMLVVFLNYRQEKKDIIGEFRATAVLVRDSVMDQLRYDSFTEITGEQDMELPAYGELQQKLSIIRISSKARCLYTARETEDGVYVYVVDGLPYGESGFACPGTPIQGESGEYLESLKRSLQGETVLSDDFTDTARGKACTAFFPVADDSAGIYASLCLEFDMDKAVRHLRSHLLFFSTIALIASLVITVLLLFFYERMKKEKEHVESINADMAIRLETIQSGISGGLSVVKDDASCAYVYVSEAAAALQGYSPEEFRKASNGNAADNVYEPDREDVRREWSAEGDTYSCKYRVVHKDGSLKWVLDSGKRVTNESGETFRYSLCQDVTAFEEINLRLKDTHTMLRQMVSSLGDGVLAYRLPSHELLVINDEARRIFDLADDFSPENMSAHLQKIMVPDDGAAMREAVGKLKKPKDKAGYMFRLLHEDGTLLTVRASSRLLEFDNGERYILSTVQDITEQWRLSELLRQERKQYRDALTNDSRYYYAFDVTTGLIGQEFTTVEGINPIRQLGLELPADFDELNQKWMEWLHPQFLDESMERLLKREELLKQFEDGKRVIEVEYHRADTDTYTRIDTLLTRSEGNGHILGFVIAHDTTEYRKEEQRKKQELLDAKAALEDAYEAANRASEAKTKFLSNMSHDIRTPMNAIVGMTAIAGTHLDDPDRVADCLGKITVSSKHLLGLINEVLDMSKIESGKVDLNEEEFNLPELIDNLLTMSKPRIEERHHELTVSVSGIEHEEVIGDSQRIQQTFMNLLSNAIKYTPDGGQIRLALSEKQTNNPRIGCFEFIFQDNGLGMSEEFQKHLFEPFARADDEHVRKIQGTGLGMAIARNIVQMMNGDIRVESRLGEGTKITVVIYLKLQDTDREVSYEEFIDLPILVADDDRTACESTCEVLAELGMKGEWVLSGEEAVKRVVSRHGENNDFFAVILDWKMPDTDGIATAKEIRRQVGSEVPIIIISAYDWSDIEQEARAAGVNAFISKPLFKSRVVHLFKELLGHGQEPQEKAETLDTLLREEFKGRRVLLVEDNELNAEIAGEIFEMAGLEIDYAKDGREGVRMMEEAESGRYDMIFMDIQMPKLNGYEATRAIRSLPGEYVKRVPIIAMTANAFAEDVQEALKAGMNEHITKPLDFKQLARILKKWLPPAER